MGKEVTGELPKTKALGVSWKYEQDQFYFQTRKSDVQFENVAAVLSVIASVYDPLGIIVPFVLVGKQLFQELWFKTKDWKKPVL